jgi:hypothetical protein
LPSLYPPPRLQLLLRSRRLDQGALQKGLGRLGRCLGVPARTEKKGQRIMSQTIEMISIKAAAGHDALLVIT